MVQGELSALLGSRPRPVMARPLTWLPVALLLAWTGVAAGAPIVDGDADGVDDTIDACLYTPPAVPVDPRGCELPDADGDGIPDAADLCPLTAAGQAVDGFGCPLPCPDGCDGDADGDGVPDALDRCPATAAAALVDADGCALDSDLDGVPDGIDRCSGTRVDQAADARGCAAGQRPVADARRRPAPSAPATRQAAPPPQAPIEPPPPPADAGRVAAPSPRPWPDASTRRLLAALHLALLQTGERRLDEAAPPRTAPQAQTPARASAATAAVPSAAAEAPPPSQERPDGITTTATALPVAAEATQAPSPPPAASVAPRDAVAPAPDAQRPEAGEIPPRPLRLAPAHGVPPGDGALARMRFAGGSAELDGRLQRQLTGVLARLHALDAAGRTYRLEVRGDVSGDVGLGMTRARLVRAWLMSRGVPPGRVAAVPARLPEADVELRLLAED